MILEAKLKPLIPVYSTFDEIYRNIRSIPPVHPKDYTGLYEIIPVYSDYTGLYRYIRIIPDYTGISSFNLASRIILSDRIFRNMLV